MAFFVTIVTDDLAKVFLRLKPFIATQMACWSCHWINLEGRSGVLRLLTSILLILLLLLFPSLLGGLSAIGALMSWSLWFLRLFWFFNPWVFYWLAIGASFGCWRPTTPEAVLIDFVSMEARPKGGFGLAVNGFFDKLLEAIKFSAALLHFDPYWGAEVFLEISNYCAFFWGPFGVKFY